MEIKDDIFAVSTEEIVNSTPIETMRKLLIQLRDRNREKEGEEGFLWGCSKPAKDIPTWSEDEVKHCFWTMLRTGLIVQKK